MPWTSSRSRTSSRWTSSTGPTVRTTRTLTGRGAPLTRRDALKALFATASAAYLAACRGDADGPPVTPSVSPSTVDTRWPIKQVIYLMLENRSFDHMFGAFPGVNGASTGVKDGVEVPLTRAPQWLPGDLPHDWGATFRHINGGKMDGFGEGGRVPVSDAFAYTRFAEEDIPNLWGWAREFSISDNFFASAKGNSYAQHLFMVAGQSGRAYDAPVQGPEVRKKRTDQGLAKTWGCDVPEGGYLLVVPEGKAPGEDDQRTQPCLDIGSQGEQLTKAGIDWAFYGAEPHQVGYIWNAYTPIRRIFHDEVEWARRVHPVDDLIRDIKRGDLPSVTWVTPRYELSDHPPWSVCFSHDWVTNIVNAVMEGPMWKHTAIFITWDEWGGFHDHVVPPDVDEFGLGIRVPNLTISPYVQRGVVDTELGDFVSANRFIADNWGLPPLSDRVRQTHNFEHVFDFAGRPRDPDPRPPLGNCRGDWRKVLQDVENWPAPFGDLET